MRPAPWPRDPLRHERTLGGKTTDQDIAAGRANDRMSYLLSAEPVLTLARARAITKRNRWSARPMVLQARRLQVRLIDDLPGAEMLLVVLEANTARKSVTTQTGF